MNNTNYEGKKALEYHQKNRPGKIEVVPTTPHRTQKDLSFAYSPGVAVPCLEIEKNKTDAYKYTAKGNLVAVISNGSAVLGLGNIGALASKPVMEGKGLLFKIFADLDVFDIELDTQDTEKFIQTVKIMSPTFGGINLEDIKAPQCFEIEERLKKELDIPVMHDDQHGTAIISAAALINAIEIAGKKFEDLKVVVNGAGAASISCSKLYIALGVKKENILMFDTKGLLSTQRKDLNKYKKEFANDKKNVKTLEDAMKNADVFLGLSKGDIVSKEMVKSMAKNPIVFALANPNPEISYKEAKESRDDVIMATGRSDHPNQVNNVLGFPYIFRGAIDVRAKSINEQMKIAAAKALAELAKQTVPEEVNKAYRVNNFFFGKDYIIPKPFDQRLIEVVTIAVAKAAIESGVARKKIDDWEKYKISLRQRMGYANSLNCRLDARAANNPKKVALVDAENYRSLKAAELAQKSRIAIPILIGKKKKIDKIIKDTHIDLKNIQIIDPNSEEQKERREFFAQIHYKKFQRSDLTLEEARERMIRNDYFSSMLLETNEVDAMIFGQTRHYIDAIKPTLQIIGCKKIISATHIVQTKRGTLFFADTTINKNPNLEAIIDITLQTAQYVQGLGIKPRVALLSYSNFGSKEGKVPSIMKKAAKYFHENYPELIIDGDIQANFALNNEILKENFPFSKLVDNSANVLIFPYISAANISYKIMQELGHYSVIGPVINGFDKSVHVLPSRADLNSIVDMIRIAVIDAQTKAHSDKN